MAFLASNVVPEKVYIQAKTRAARLKEFTQGLRDQFAATGADTGDIQALAERLANDWQFFEDVRAVPGIAAYAQGAEDDPGYDVVSEFNAMQTAVDGLLAEIIATFPTSAGGYIDGEQWSRPSAGQFVRTARTFNPGMLTGLIAEADLLIAAIS